MYNVPVNRDFRYIQNNHKTDHSLKTDQFVRLFPFFLLFDYFQNLFYSFYGPQVINIFIYVVKLMHQSHVVNVSAWSMPWYGQCTDVGDV